MISAVVLVGVGRVGRHDQVRRPGPGHLLQRLLHRVPLGREPALGQVVQINGDAGAGQERLGRVAGFQVTFRGPGQHDVVDPETRLTLGQAEQRASGPDLDVVGMGAEGEHRQRPVRRGRETQWQHAPHRSGDRSPAVVIFGPSSPRSYGQQSRCRVSALTRAPHS